MFGMWPNVIKPKLNARECWPAVSNGILVRGGRGFRAGATHGLQLDFGCQVIRVLLKGRLQLVELRGTNYV